MKKPKACRSIGCPNTAEAGQSWCEAHQLAAWEAVPADLRRRLAVRMVEGITTNPSGCWLYAGDRNPENGYAVTEHVGGRTSVHRWMYWYLKGRLKLGHHLHHVCGGVGAQDTRHCIRPAHLVQILPGDHQEETRLRAAMIAAADPGSRFYQVEHGERGWSAEFARALDLPRHEPRWNEELTTEDVQVMDWNLIIPERFQVPSH
ncbi:hypothetical protein ACT4S5_07665 [Kocuria oceani]|uniref:hypothetical protein n=1 Tax=Kocuria oceani TaxID=988827 RepID=UPI0040371B20